MKLFCRDEMQRLEMAAVAAGVPLSQLMDNAGAAVAQEVERRCRPVGGKRAVVLANPQFTPLYTPYLYDTVGPAPEQPTLVSVDIATESLLPFSDLAMAGNIQLAIDHHESHEDFAPLALVDGHAAACGEVIYALLRQMQVPISPEIGTALYVAISTDTGCFKYSNTSANTLRTAADLKELGVDLYHINKILFATKTLGRLRL